MGEVKQEVRRIKKRMKDLRRKVKAKPEKEELWLKELKEMVRKKKELATPI